jgi:hypothetical protein
MRKLTAIVLGLALLVSASTASAVAEKTELYLSYNLQTGDWGVSNCDVLPGYTVAAKASMYPDSANNMGGGTPCSASMVYLCQRAVYVGGYYKYDLFGSKNCANYGASQIGTLGYALDSNCDGGTALYLCGYYVYATGTGQGGAPIWYEYRTSTSCSGGSQYEFLGYVKGELYAPNDWGTNCGLDCFGSCGADCKDPLGGTPKYTPQCLAHDQCVVDHGCNIWSLDCLGDFIAAAASYVVAVVKSFWEGVKKAWNKFKHWLSNIF